MTKGQILENSDFCQSINDIFSKYKPQTVLEIGTWKGMGSTKCIINNVIEYNTKTFISIESNLTFHTEAQINLTNYLNYVHLLYGKIIEINDINSFVSTQELNSNEKIWLQEDLINISKAPNVLSSIPENIDFLLLDGGEFSTYSEWLKLKDRSKIIALDDTSTTKCRKIKQEVLADQNSSYKILKDSNERNGFMILENNYS
jgi:hypothetical protein